MRVGRSQNENKRERNTERRVKEKKTARERHADDGRGQNHKKKTKYLCWVWWVKVIFHVSRKSVESDINPKNYTQAWDEMFPTPGFFRRVGSARHDQRRVAARKSHSNRSWFQSQGFTSAVTHSPLWIHLKETKRSSSCVCHWNSANWQTICILSFKK